MTMIGHNNPPTDHEMIREELKDRNAKVLDRTEKLVEAADRAPDTIEDQDTADKMADLSKQITVCINALEDRRKTEKAPYWDMCKVVDGFFGDKNDILTAAKNRIKKVERDWLSAQEKKERERRAELEREAKAARDEEIRKAAELEEAGKKTQSEAVMQKAISHDHDAAFFGEAAQARGSAVAVSVGMDTGAKSSLRYVWTGEIEDRDAVDLEKLRPYISNDVLQKAINSAVKAGARTIKGVKIYEKADVVTR